MRLTFSICLFCILQSFAIGTFSQNQRLSINQKNISIENIIQMIEDKTDYYFMYSALTVDVKRTVDMEATNKSVPEILDDLFKDTDISWKINGRLIALSKMRESTSVAQQPRTIAGKVTDSSGAPLPGVTVVVKGTTSGTITGVDGNYTLTNVPADAMLEFSFVGMKTQEIPVAGKTSINVIMTEETIGIEEVVAIGYGTSSKRKLSTAISSVKSDEITEIPISNVGDALTGRVAGVVADNGDGNPGGKPVIRIRGYGSIYAGSEPLYVIDGMLASADQFAALNPKSIEKMDILKDAAAGAIYGSRAGNGVIIVTTKTGEAGQAKVMINSTIGVQQLERKVDVLNRDEWLAMAKEAYTNDNLTIPDFYLRDPSTYADTDWQDEIYRLSSYQNHQASIGGGTEKMKYYLSINYLGNEGIMKTIYNNSLSSNGNFEIKVKPNLTVGTTFNTAQIKQRSNQAIMGFGHMALGYGVAGGIIQQSLWLPPIIPVYTSTGDYGQLMQGEFVPPYFTQGYANPVSGLNEIYDVYTNYNVMSRTYFTYKPVKGLSLNASYSWALYSRYRDYHTSPYLGGNGSPYANFSTPKYDKIAAGQENYMGTYWLTEFFADYETDIKGEHRFKISVGGSLQNNDSRSTTATSSVNDRGTANALNPLPAFTNYFRPNIYGAALVLGGGSYGASKFESLFARFNYDYKDKYILMASIRRDGSSKFAPNRRFGVFPRCFRRMAYISGIVC
ncbi:MAG: SusC/RagA family TonB-linked outer membrane protein [Mangrovibacterium sp.]